MKIKWNRFISKYCFVSYHKYCLLKKIVLYMLQGKGPGGQIHHSNGEKQNDNHKLKGKWASPAVLTPCLPRSLRCSGRSTWSLCTSESSALHCQLSQRTVSVLSAEAESWAQAVTRAISTLLSSDRKVRRKLLKTRTWHFYPVSPEPEPESWLFCEVLNRFWS